MNWNQQDNKHYRGPIDRVFVSRTESYEVHHFIEHYLKSRGYAPTDANRKIVGDKLMSYKGRAPIQHADLEAHLDLGWTK